MSKLIKADNEYKEWITGISTDFRKSQIRASMKINDEMLRFYWRLGKGIASMSEQFGYGMGFYKTVSDDLKSILPDVKSFSPTNLKYMRYFYEMYPDAVICSQVEDELITEENRPQVGDDFQIIFRIPWGHNKIILDKCKGNSAKALFYIRKTIENNWSRDVLLNFLGTDLYERQGKAITNFSNTLPIEQSDLAQAITKDEVYESIYKQAKSSIYVIDNYIGLRTLVHLKNSPTGVDIILFSDNVGNNKSRKEGVSYVLVFKLSKLVFYTENLLISEVRISIFTVCGTGFSICRISWEAAVCPINFLGISMVVSVGSMTRPSEILSNPMIAISSGRR